MASKKSADPARTKPGSGKKLAVPAVALLLGVFVGPKLLGGGGSGEAAAATTTTTAPGPVVALDPITLNLVDGHLLKVGLALQVSASWLAEHETEGDGGHGGGEEADDPTRGYARALDAAITVFSDRSMADLSAAAGREAAREELASRLAETYHGEIEAVYLYEFVMQ